MLTAPRALAAHAAGAESHAVANAATAIVIEWLSRPHDSARPVERRAEGVGCRGR
jgi:hypothetical protein